MNAVDNRGLHSQLRDEEAVVVENAVRLAIDSVLNVLYGVTGARSREYQRMVADRDKEIQRLEGRLTEIERELQVLRGHGCACGLFDTGTRMSGNRQTGERSRSAGSVGVGPEGPAGPPECDVSLSLGVYAPAASHFSSRYQESILPSSPSCPGVTSTCTSRSSEATEAARNLPTSPSSLVVKEEPCDVDAVLIEWQLSEERAAESEGRAGSPGPAAKRRPAGSFSPEHLDNSERQMLREETIIRPAAFQITAGDRLKNNKKKNVPTSQLTEEAQRLKRAAWRAASKRYYARKVARQQAALPPGGPAVGPAWRRPASDFPEEPQVQRREVWRAASRRFYDRRAARHQADASPFTRLPETLSPAGAAQGPDGEGPRVIRGGIMCS